MNRPGAIQLGAGTRVPNPTRSWSTAIAMRNIALIRSAAHACARAMAGDLDDHEVDNDYDEIEIDSAGF